MAEADPGPLAGLAAVPEVTVADAADLDARLIAIESERENNMNHK